MAVFKWLPVPAALLALTGGVYRFTFYNPIPRREDPYDIPSGKQYQDTKKFALELIREFDEQPYEQVYIDSFDGLRLSGHYYHVRDGAPLQIQMHGYHGTTLRDFSGGNRLAVAAGHNRLVIEERAHGGSDGHTITFGVKERLDCKAWAEYAAARFGKEIPIVLVGVSMGAATVLMASDLELPENVRCIVADCPFTSPRAIIRDVCHRSAPLMRPLLPLVGPAARLFGRFDLDGASAVDAVAHTRLPILLIHGEDDRFVPCAMSRELAAACAGPVRLETFPGAGHGLSYLVDPERYGRVVTEFLHENGID
ncbi:MAG: alpha/beta hydrolase [Oscillospiraceae bacterium]|nr:alpha/beta hydrolase [Oscillospiraceae bacterium]